MNKPLRKGDLVRFTLAIDEVEGRVEEDRGAIGVGGRRLYRVSFQLGLDEQASIELPADQLRPNRDAAAAA